jgi:chromosome segregation ATPase
MTTLERLEKRVSALEMEVEGEKVVTRYILEQVRRNGDDLAALRTRVGRVEERLDVVERRLSDIEMRLGRLETEVRSLRRDLPGIIADTMREVLREHRPG